MKKAKQTRSDRNDHSTEWTIWGTFQRHLSMDRTLSATRQYPRLAAFGVAKNETAERIGTGPPGPVKL